MRSGVEPDQFGSPRHLLGATIIDLRLDSDILLIPSLILRG